MVPYEEQVEMEERQFEEMRHAHRKKLFLVSMLTVAIIYSMFLFVWIGSFFSDLQEELNREFGGEELFGICGSFKWFLCTICIGIGGCFAFAFSSS